MKGFKHLSPSPSEHLAALRILDANRNRASEGLRVVEEFCRFALADQHLTRLWKQLRHDLIAALDEIPRADLIVARETQLDVGTAVTTLQEGSRHSLAHVVDASCQRIQQALRVMEEYCKFATPTTAKRIENLRYQAYTLAKACTITAESQQRLQSVQLYVLVDAAEDEAAFANRLKVLIAAGVHALQLRDKSLDDRSLTARARLARAQLDEAVTEPASRPLLIMNDRPDIAVLAKADGVHVGQDELTVHDTRQIVGPHMLIGVSTHTIQQARQAVLDGANYIGCGPTFPSPTKHFDDFPGTPFLQQVAAEISLPAFAIGGITLENLPRVQAAGFTRIAIGHAIANNPQPHAATASFLTALTSHPHA